jgi:hypothetical protein
MPSLLTRLPIIAVALATSVAALAPAQTNDETGARAAGRIERDIPWQVMLGARARMVDAAFPVIDRVVLVPDGATYLDELAKWSPSGRWPVLIEDDHLCGMFIRRFDPAQVIRRGSVGELPDESEARRRLIERVVIHAWGGNADAIDLRDTFARQDFMPAGVVIASVTDLAWPAAAALAAGRGQPIAWLADPFNRPNGTLTDPELERLRSAVDQLVAAQGYPYAALGDAIDAITICRAIAGKADAQLAPEARVSLPPDLVKPPYAITDLLGRHADGSRYAITGWIWGDEIRCAYIAMCGLFLPRERVSLINTYPNGEGWAPYDPATAAAELNGQGYETDLTPSQGARWANWMHGLPGGRTADIIAMNTKGLATYFDLSVGRGYAADVPVLNTPAALHLIHSWSMQSPENRDTIGGRWLERGVYAYVGAADEPLLNAFVTPTILVRRMMTAAPFLVSARRHAPHAFAGVWKINTFGDPLMTLSLAGESSERVEQPATYGTDLLVRAKAVMREAASGDGAALRESIELMALLGHDDVAVKLWRYAEENDLTTDAARPALGSLFRVREDQAFIHAFRAAPYQTDLDRDMLWHLLTPRLNSLNDAETLMLLEANVRRPMQHVDLRRLAPHLTRVLGREHTINAVQREIERAKRPQTRRQLEKMLNQLRSPGGP